MPGSLEPSYIESCHGKLAVGHRPGLVSRRWEIQPTWATEAALEMTMLAYNLMDTYLAIIVGFHLEAYASNCALR